MTDKITQAFILAAGYGERARPLSLVRPKPLFPLLDRVLISHVLDRMSAAGVDRAVVNAHHLADRLADHLTGHSFSPMLRLVRENTILGTGGGLKNAAPLLRPEPFFVANSDIYCDLDLNRLAREHLARRPMATLVLHDRPGLNRVAVDGAGKIVGFRGRLKPGTDPAKTRHFAFTGLQALEPEVLAEIPDGPGDVIEAYQAMVESGRTMRAMIVEDVKWWDAGTLESYLGLHADILNDRPEGPIHIADGAEISPGAVVRGWAAVYEGARVEDGATVENSVLWPGSRVAAGVAVKGCVLADGASAGADVENMAVTISNGEGEA